jgi:hypothetical protein
MSIRKPTAPLTIMVAALTLMAVAISPAMAKGRKGQQAAPKTEDAAKSKADEAAYQNAIKAIPDSTAKTDPWQGVRAAH